MEDIFKKLQEAATIEEKSQILEKFASDNMEPEEKDFFLEIMKLVIKSNKNEDKSKS